MPEVAPLAPSLTAENLSPSTDRDRVDAHLERFLVKASQESSNPRIRSLLDQIASFVLRGGKRIRPRLALASYRILAGRASSPPKPVWMAASSLELFHGFMLVHDDLIDGSLIRRGEPTLHEAIRLAGDSPTANARQAADLGLVAGDLLCALGMRMVARSGLDDSVLAQVHALVADMLFETGLGEALDILHDSTPLESIRESQILETYVRKTARYSVSAPLALGATIAGAAPKTVKSLSRFGEFLGLGYQIQNDLEIFDHDPTFPIPDLDSGKRTLLLWHAYKTQSDDGRAALCEALRMPPGIDRRRRLLDLIASSPAVSRCRAELESLLRNADNVLLDCGLDADRRRAFLSLAAMLPQHAAGPEQIHELASEMT